MKKNSIEFFISILNEEERIHFGAKIKKGLADKKKRGESVGSPNFKEVQKIGVIKTIEKADKKCLEIYEHIEKIAQRDGFTSLEQIGMALRCMEIKTPLGKLNWSPTQVRNAIKRAESLNGKKIKRRSCRVCKKYGYKGIEAYGEKWRSFITVNEKTFVWGCFNSKIEAAKAYDKKAVELGRSKRYLNFPEDYPNHDK